MQCVEDSLQPSSPSCLILGLRVRLSLVKFCLICGTSLQGQLVKPLDHILSSACFGKSKGDCAILEVQLYPGKEDKKTDNEVKTEIQWRQQEEEIEEDGHDEEEDVDEVEEHEEEEEEETEEREEDTIFGCDSNLKPRKKFMNDIARERHTCPLCPAFFSTTTGLSQHTTLLHSEAPLVFPCSLCQIDFPSLQELCKHSTLSLHQGRTFNCFLCNKQVKNLSGHLETHVGERKHVCTVPGCELAFVQKVSLTKHLECHGESRFKCEQCGDKFYRAETLRSHLKSKHDQEDTFQCTYCGHWFLDHETLKKHRKAEHKVATPGQAACLLCGEYVLGSAMRKHFKEKHLEDLQVEQSPCQFCGKLINSLLLRNHTKNEHPDEVQDEFLHDPETAELERMVVGMVEPEHRRRRKEKERKMEEEKKEEEEEEKEKEEEEASPAIPGSNNTGSIKTTQTNTDPCPYCGKYFLRNSLSQHIKTSHYQALGIKSKPRAPQQFTCLLCGHKTKASWFKLVDHFQVHSTINPELIQCKGQKDCCGEGGFSDLVSLHRHYWTEHKAGVECSLCHIIVKNKAYMEGHMVGHSTAKDFPCSYCVKSFKTKIQLDIHESRHTGQGRYECSICGKRFPQKGEVRNHELQHGQERGFVCDLCGKAFARDAYLRIHMKTHKGSQNSGDRKNQVVSHFPEVLSS